LRRRRWKCSLRWAFCPGASPSLHSLCYDFLACAAVNLTATNGSTIRI
jgi:hypothetical protein